MIHIKDISFSYDNKKSIFNEFSLDLEIGNIYGLLGRNGAGKSTLLKIISGLAFPKSGEVTVRGEVPRYRTPQFLQEIYLVTEEFQLPEMIMDRYVKLHSPFYPRFMNEQFDTYLEEFGLSRDSKLSEMSYGEKKKFLLSFGLATDCKLLILDEPTNGLDIPSKSQFRRVVAGAMYEERTFIISTHQARDMDNLIDPIIVLDEGELVFFEGYEQIAKELTVSKQKQLDPTEDIVYAESSIGGHTVVKRNTGQEEANMNLELLFNAIISNKNEIQQIFKTK